MNIGAIQKELLTALLTIYAEGEAAIICNWVMEHHTAKTNVERRMNAGLLLPATTILAIHTATAALLQHKPVQYVLGETSFMDLKFYVDENVLIPRPETEELLAYLVENCQLPVNHNYKVLDIGTGSGCIPICIKKRMPFAEITSLDISHGALQVAIKNAATHGVEVQFVHQNFLDESKWQTLASFDIIISNPPYIPLSEKAKLDKHVTAWEPGTALFVADNEALIFYKKIAAFGQKKLSCGGRIFVEMHQDYALATKKMFEENGYETELKKDINGNDRMLMAW